MGTLQTSSAWHGEFISTISNYFYTMPSVNPASQLQPDLYEFQLTFGYAALLCATSGAASCLMTVEQLLNYVTLLVAQPSAVHAVNRTEATVVVVRCRPCDYRFAKHVPARHNQTSDTSTSMHCRCGGQQLASGSYDGEIILWGGDTGKPRMRLQPSEQEVSITNQQQQHEQTVFEIDCIQ